MPVIILGGIYGRHLHPHRGGCRLRGVRIVRGRVHLQDRPPQGDVGHHHRLGQHHRHRHVHAPPRPACLPTCSPGPGWTWPSAAALESITGGSTIIFFLIVNIILLIAGCFLDSTSGPVHLHAPVRPTWPRPWASTSSTWGVVMIVNLAIGLYTPPRGRQPVCGLRRRKGQSEADLQGRGAAADRLHHRATDCHVHPRHFHPCSRPDLCLKKGEVS